MSTPKPALPADPTPHLAPVASPATAPLRRGVGLTVTEVGLLLVAVALVAACAVFVAAEFSLTTVEHGALERAAEAGEGGASTALKAVRRLTFELSGAQLGITLTSLLIGMLAEPSVSALLHGPLSAVGFSDRAAETIAVVLGIVLSTVVLMVFGELVPKNWAISRPLEVAKIVAAPLYYFSAAFSPLIGHLNNTANRFVRRRGWSPPSISVALEAQRSWWRSLGTRPTKAPSSHTRRRCSFVRCASGI